MTIHNTWKEEGGGFKGSLKLKAIYNIKHSFSHYYTKHKLYTELHHVSNVIIIYYFSSFL